MESAFATGWGLIIFLIGAGAAFVSVHDAVRWRRLTDSGVTVPAEIIETAVHRGDSFSGSRTEYSITASWTWDGSDHQKLFLVPRRIHDMGDDTPIQVVFDAAKPDAAMLVDKSSRSTRQLLSAVVGVLIAIVGLVMFLLGAGLWVR